MKYSINMFGVLLVLAPQVVNAQDKPALTAPALKSLLTGNSMAGNGKHKDPAIPYDWTAFYATDGTVTMRLKPEWGGATDSGK